MTAEQATSVVLGLGLRARLALDLTADLEGLEPGGFEIGRTRVPLENGSLRVRWSSGLDDPGDQAVVGANRALLEGLSPGTLTDKVVLVGPTDPAQTPYYDTPVGRLPEILVHAAPAWNSDGSTGGPKPWR